MTTGQHGSALRRLAAPPRTLAGRMGRERDNVLALRHVAASAVIFSHCFALAAGAPGLQEPLSRVIPGLDAGRLALHVFFLLSGLLVTHSWLRQPRIGRFVASRVLRVFPGWLACLLATVLLLGPVASTLPVGDYFAHPGTWRHLVANADLMGIVWTLPGVFEGNPHAGVVNGSIWSLGLEIRLYAYLVVLALLGVLSRRWAATPLFLAVLALAAWETWTGKPDPFHYRALTTSFVVGALFALHPARVPVSGRLLVVLAALALLASAHVAEGLRPILALVALLYGVLWIAFALPRLPFPPGLDLSYGIFLYGFPVQQAWMAGMPALGPWSLFALSLPVAAACAWISWHAVERPALGLLRRRDRDAAVRNPPPAV